MAEYWDIFDMDRRSTGRQHLRGTPMADGDYHLVVNIWVVNSAGQVLLTQHHLLRQDFQTDFLTGLPQSGGQGVFTGDCRPAGASPF